jgi:RNA polymerase sigma-70 factor (ECF subfamily)
MASANRQLPAEDVRAAHEEAPSDRSLLRRHRRGDREAADLLYRRYAHRLLALARSRQASDVARQVEDEDIVQSVFGSFFRGVARGSYDVPDGEELWNLFVVITLNKIRAKGVYHRAAKRDVRNTVGVDGIERYPVVLESDDHAFAILKMSVDEALARLPSQYRVVLESRLEGYEVAEIARTVGRSKRSVERILHECRETLSTALGDR